MKRLPFIALLGAIVLVTTVACLALPQAAPWLAAGGAASAGVAALLYPPVTFCALANVDPGTWTIKTYLADAAISRYRLVKIGSDAGHIAACGAADVPLGLATDQATAAEAGIAVRLLGLGAETMRLTASEEIAAGAYVYTAASGKVQDEPALAGTYYLVGRALTAAAADGAEIVVAPCLPLKLVVAATLAALTSTDGTAAGAADVNALKPETEKIGDDVRAVHAKLLATFGGAALIKILGA